MSFHLAFMLSMIAGRDSLKEILLFTSVVWFRVASLANASAFSLPDRPTCDDSFSSMLGNGRCVI